MFIHTLQAFGITLKDYLCFVNSIKSEVWMLLKAWHNEKIRYILIGGYNTLFGYSVFALLWMLWAESLHYVIILSISHVIAVTNAFFGYRILVFRKEGEIWGDFARFNMVYLGAFSFNVLTLPILIEVVNLHPLVAQALLVIVTVIASYLLHRRFSFRLGQKVHIKNTNF